MREDIPCEESRTSFGLRRNGEWEHLVGPGHVRVQLNAPGTAAVVRVEDAPGDAVIEGDGGLTTAAAVGGKRAFAGGGGMSQDPTPVSGVQESRRRKGNLLKQPGRAGSPSLCRCLVDPGLLVEALAGEIGTGPGERGVVGIAGGVLWRRVERLRGHDAGMCRDKSCQQRKEKECKKTHREGSGVVG